LDIAPIARAAPPLVGRQLVRAQCVSGSRDSAAYVVDQIRLQDLPVTTSVWVEVEHFDQIGALTGQLFVAENVNVKLILCHVFGLCAL
jgi:hypothetical protein